MAIITSPLFTRYHTFTPSKPFSRGIQWSMDARRAIIFFRRVSQQTPNLEAGIDTKIFGSFSPNTRDHSEITPYRDDLKNRIDTAGVRAFAPNTNTHSKFFTLGESPDSSGSFPSDAVYIIIKDAWGDLPALHKVKLPFIPKTLEYNSESTFAAIKPMGRNTARYHFTGSEDKLEFEIDWHSFEENRQDVIRDCRIIESLSKSDGYFKSPPTIILQWGRNNYLFGDHEFVVIKAPYRLVQFNRSQIFKGSVQNTYMLPVQAYQQVTLARISNINLSTIKIKYVNVSQNR